MTTKEKELFEKKVTIKDWLVIKLCNILNLPKNYTGTIVCMDFNTPKVMKLVKAYFHQARVIFMEQANFEKLFGISGLYYKDEGERIDMLKSIEGNLIIIANPPYGAIGANIAYTIREKVDYECFVNLLPVNDYKRNKTKDLFNYQSEMIFIKGGFADAAVTTHLAKIHKTKNNDMTLDEFERSNFVDRSLDKYFEENYKREHYAIDKIPGAGQTIKKLTPWQVTNTFIIAMRDMNHKCMGGKNSVTYKWNVDESVNFNYIIENYNTRDNRLFIAQCMFNSDIEKDNFVKFIYYGNEARFVQKLFTAINCDGTIKKHVFPKVDWTRSWTVEEILADYGYTEDEIKEVMEDLKNFKGMDD